MNKKYLRRNICCLFSGAILIGTLTSCEKKSEKALSEPKVTASAEPRMKEVPIQGQMPGHGGMGGMSGGAAIKSHGGMGGGSMGAHGGMPGKSMGGAHSGMLPEVRPGDLAEPFKAKRK